MCCIQEQSIIYYLNQLKYFQEKLLTPYSLVIAFLLMFSSTSFAIEVVDGDTLKQDGTTFRLEGIDAPEHGQKCKNASGRTWPCGKNATLHLKKLVDGKQVECLGNEIDVSIGAVCIYYTDTYL